MEGPVRFPAVRPLPVALVVAVLLVGCSTTPPTTSTSVGERGQVLSALRTEVAEVAELQAGADRAVNDVLSVVRRVDEALDGLDGAATFEATLDDYAPVHAEVAATQAEGLRDGYLAVAEAVDEARATLAAARVELDGDPWEVEYLDAQDQVLVLVRSYAETADQLAQLLERHWPTYVEVDGRIVEFADGRANYRDTEEAVNALAVELDPLRDDLVVAQAQLADFGQQRTVEGRAVNDATADLRSIYERRPEGVSS